MVADRLAGGTAVAQAGRRGRRRRPSAAVPAAAAAAVADAAVAAATGAPTVATAGAPTVAAAAAAVAPTVATQTGRPALGVRVQAAEDAEQQHHGLAVHPVVSPVLLTADRLRTVIATRSSYAHTQT